MAAISPAYTPLTITGIRVERPGIKTLKLAYPDGTIPTYKAGQFLTFVFHHHEHEERRSFSISSSPALQEQLSITVKRIDNGSYSRLLCDRASVGDILYTTGAAGLFILPAEVDRYKQVFFFAAGIGITPVFSMIKTLLHTQEPTKVVLIYSNRSHEETVFYDELNELVTSFRYRFKIQYLYSTDFDLRRARLSKELVPVLLREYILAAKEEMLFYICGPYSYMRMVTWSLEEQGIHTEQIRKENFNPNDRVIAVAQPPKKGTYNVTIQYANTSMTITCAYPESILQAAKKNNIALPYSCENGQCGSCAAQCTAGTVWHSYNEVLTDADLKAGKILTCTGHPVNGDITIQL